MKATHESYEDRLDRYLDLIDLADRTEARMMDADPGSEMGFVLYRLLRRVEAAAAEARKQMLNHPDAPPQG